MRHRRNRWESFGVHISTSGIDINGSGHGVTHTLTETSHLLQIRLDPAVMKETIKVRLVRPGLLEIEWPRAAGEESAKTWGSYDARGLFRPRDDWQRAAACGHRGSRWDTAYR